MKRKIGAREYNQRLLTVLIIIALVVSIGAVIIGIAASNEKDDENQKQDVVITETPEADEVKNDGSEQPAEELPENNEVVVSQPEQQPETEPEIQEPVEDTTEDGDGMLILANPWNKLPEDFTVELQDIGSGHRVDKRIVEDLNQMMADLCRDGRNAFVCSSYRTNTKQTTLYNNEVNDYLSRGYSEEDAAIEAAKWVAIPGTSEHQTGLAVDIMSSYYLVLDRGQEDTAEQQWLMENSYRYGFILRYPSDKSELTGIYYEPWHYRYVGKTAAKEIYEKGICFEEYLLN